MQKQDDDLYYKDCIVLITAGEKLVENILITCNNKWVFIFTDY